MAGNSAFTINDLFVNIDPWLKVLLFYISAMVGSVAHWFKSRKTEQTVTTLKYWYSNMKQTLFTFGSVIGASLPIIGPIDLISVSVLTLATTGFSIGFASDSAFNSETPTDNTPVE
jgi:hypothetical protein